MLISTFISKARAWNSIQTKFSLLRIMTQVGFVITSSMKSWQASHRHVISYQALMSYHATQRPHVNFSFSYRFPSEKQTFFCCGENIKSYSCVCHASLSLANILKTIVFFKIKYMCFCSQFLFDNYTFVRLFVSLEYPIVLLAHNKHSFPTVSIKEGVKKNLSPLVDRTPLVHWKQNSPHSTIYLYLFDALNQDHWI